MVKMFILEPMMGVKVYSDDTILGGTAAIDAGGVRCNRFGHNSIK